MKSYDVKTARRVYQRRLVGCFAAAFTIFAVALITFQIRFDTQTKRQDVENDLDAYAEILMKADDYNYVASLFPEDLRSTVLDTAGNVLFDRIGGQDIENHSDRPEIAGLKGNDTIRTTVRVSATTGTKYLYYSKICGDRIIRMALPYDEDVRTRIRPNSIFLLVSAMLFAITLLVIVLLSSHLGADIISFQEQYKNDSEREMAVIKQQMTSNISHELRTPVTGIMGYLETLESCPDMDEERRRSFIHRAYVQSVRLSDLIRDMALISKIEESPEKLEKQIVNLKEIMDDVASEFTAGLEKSGDVLENRLPPDLRIRGNRTLLHALFRNLVENSVKYAGGGVTLCLECADYADAGFEDCGDSVCLTYYDTGAGVPSQYIPRLFERFYRVAEGRTRDAGGSGLGLSIVRNAVAFHGGEIRVVNRRPHGLQFFFLLEK